MLPWCQPLDFPSGREVTIFDNRAHPGGLNTYGVAEYKLRPADSLREVELVRSMGVEFRQEMVGTSVSMEELERRLEERATESSGVIEERLETAKEQLELRNRFDHVVENDDRERAADDLAEIVAQTLNGAATMARP